MKIPSKMKLVNKDDLEQNPSTVENQRRALLRKTLDLTATGIVHTPASGKKIRLYNIRFSLSADMTSVAYKFGAGANFEKITNPKGGGLYGTNTHPDYTDGAIDEALTMTQVGTGTVTTNLVYEEI